MNQQFMLFALGLVALLLFMRNTPGNGLAYAFSGPLQRFTFSGLYESVKLVFEKEADELKGLIKEGIDGIKEQVKGWKNELEEADKKAATKEEIENIKSEQKKTLEKMQEQLDDLSTKASRLETNDEKKGKGLMNEVESEVLKLKNSKTGALKELWDEKGRGGKELNIDLKAVSNMTTAYGLTGANANIMRAFETEPGVAKDPTTQLFVTDIISTGTTDSHTVFWTERALLEGGAGQVAEAAKFPQISAKYEKKSATSKKTAAYAKLTEEMVEDVEYIVSEIQDEIVNGPNSIRVQLENQLLTGDGTGENHRGLFTYATAFAVPTGFQTLEAPNMYDASRAAILQILKANYMASHFLVNPSDLLNMELTKDANGNYVIPPFIGQNGMVVAGVRVVANNRIGEGDFLVGDMPRAKLFMKRSLTLKFFDQNEDDALFDLRTITGSLRAIFRVKGPDTKAFVKGSFADVINAIKTP
ncbi:hypothetical protein GCM10027299_21850 [Larkinella ripae]